MKSMKVYPVKRRGRTKPDSAFESLYKARVRATCLNEEHPKVYRKWVVGRPFFIYIEG